MLGADCTEFSRKHYYLQTLCRFYIRIYWYNLPQRGWFNRCGGLAGNKIVCLYQNRG